MKKIKSLSCDPRNSGNFDREITVIRGNRGDFVSIFVDKPFNADKVADFNLSRSAAEKLRKALKKALAE